MKITPLLIGLLITGIAGAQPADTVLIEKSTRHQLLKGTRVYIIPPRNFEESADFAGVILKEEGCNIQVVETPFPFAGTLIYLKDKEFQKRGLRIKKRTKLVINNMQGLFFDLDTEDSTELGIHKMMLTFGDAKTTWIVNAEYAAGIKDRGDEIRSSMLTVFVDRKISIDKKGNLPYYINLRNTAFKFSDGVTDGLISYYTKDGKRLVDPLLESGIAIRYYNDVVAEADQSEYSKTQLKEAAFPAFNTYKFQWIKPVTINGLTGYESLQTDNYTDTGKRARIYYQVTLFSSKRAYIIACYARKDFDNYMALFRKLVKSFTESQSL